MIDKNKKILVVGEFKKNYQLDKPKGVSGRSSNNDLVKKVLN